MIKFHAVEQPTGKQTHGFMLTRPRPLENGSTNPHRKVPCIRPGSLKGPEPAEDGPEPQATKQSVPPPGVASGRRLCHAKPVLSEQSNTRRFCASEAKVDVAAHPGVGCGIELLLDGKR